MRALVHTHRGVPTRRGFATLPSPDDSTGLAMAPGQVIAGKYELLHLLGRGSMGQVWAARHRELGEDVALKVLAPGLREAGGPDEMAARPGRRPTCPG
jgi:serine/threonine protein kinase